MGEDKTFYWAKVKDTRYLAVDGTELGNKNCLTFGMGLDALLDSTNSKYNCVMIQCKTILIYNMLDKKNKGFKSLLWKGTLKWNKHTSQN